MDDMEKMHRWRMMEDLGVFHDAEEENLNRHSRVKKEMQRMDKEIATDQVVSSEESEEKEDDDGEDTRRRYDLRQRKAVERYQAPLEIKKMSYVSLKEQQINRLDNLTLVVPSSP
ncbi:hypothetical protein AV530_017690 [Patagioenas fasciata monilis]|uniref:Uncharacterized protein n=1 Tax=Patagioenas fasciata monilis TaxID=372326 RepID=A0A1V4KVG7_PATFA|nr:hypothetical protein AV530_017690 [Patagioenas fasciata monilis]OPJ88345.1 hypothetical protein AV530_017690 [Patagioenas fasciata monilis]